MRHRTAVRLAVPALTIAALGGFVAVESQHAREVHDAEMKIQQAFEPFTDPAVVQLAQQTAFVSTARARAPYVTGHMTDGQVVALATGVCRELAAGTISRDLSIRHGRWGGDELVLETSSIVNAAHRAYCPDADLNSSGVLDAEIVR